MRFAELESREVAIWGFGREGRAALSALRMRFPDKPLTLYCKPEEAQAFHAIDPPLEGQGSKVSPPREPAPLNIRTDAPDAGTLASHEVVIKSPGISAYRPEIIEAQ